NLAENATVTPAVPDGGAKPKANKKANKAAKANATDTSPTEAGALASDTAEPSAVDPNAANPDSGSGIAVATEVPLNAVPVKPPTNAPASNANPVPVTAESCAGRPQFLDHLGFGDDAQSSTNEPATRGLFVTG